MHTCSSLWWSSSTVSMTKFQMHTRKGKKPHINNPSPYLKPDFTHIYMKKCQALFSEKNSSQTTQLSSQTAVTSLPVLSHLPQPGQENIHLNSCSIYWNKINLFQACNSDVMHSYCTNVCHVVPEINQRQAK